MAAPMDNTMIDAQEGDKDLYCDIKATVATGFEPVAKEEAEEKLKAVTTVGRGNIKIHLPISQVKQVLELGCIDHCSVLVSHVPDFAFTADEVDNMRRLRSYVGQVNWPHGLRVWREIYSTAVADRPEVTVEDFGEPVVGLVRQQKQAGSKKSKRSKRNKRLKKDTEAALTESADIKSGSTDSLGESKEKVVETPGIPEPATQGSTESETSEVLAKPPDSDSQSVPEGTESSALETKSSEHNASNTRQRLNPWNPTKPAFRVTCNRNGDDHCFSSMTAAANFGGAIYRYFGWNVEMEKFDIEVILDVQDQEVTVSLGLTKESLHKRNIGHFGPTTLRPTLAYNMLRLCDIKPGDVVCDPMCGSGSIPIQAALDWDAVYHLCGDISKKAVRLTRNNIDYKQQNQQQKALKPFQLDAVTWDVCNLALKDQSVDVFITDLPFGVRVGSKAANWKLYHGALTEMARVCRPSTGRACLLTQDKKCMIKTLQMVGQYWHRSRTLGINIGGLAAGVFVLQRTLQSFSEGGPPVPAEAMPTDSDRGDGGSGSN